MKVPSELPQFNKNPTCFVVVTKFTAKFYFVYKGVLKKISDIKQKKLSYSDREGFFMRRGKGRMYGTGSVYESKDEELARRFSKRASDKLKELISKYKVRNIFIFEPSHLNYRLWSNLSVRIQKKVKHRIRGNYSNMHPLSLVEKLSISCNKKERVLV